MIPNSGRSSWWSSSFFRIYPVTFLALVGLIGWDHWRAARLRQTAVNALVETARQHHVDFRATLESIWSLKSRKSNPRIWSDFSQPKPLTGDYFVSLAAFGRHPGELADCRGALGQVTHLGPIRAVHLNQCRVLMTEFEELSRLMHLKILVLGYGHIDTASPDTLWKGGTWSQLEDLQLPGTVVPFGAVQAACRNGRLRRIGLSGAMVNDVTVAELSRSPLLKVVWATSGRFSTRALRQLLESDSIENLSLWGCEFTVDLEGTEAVDSKAAPAAGRLFLNLSATNVSDNLLSQLQTDLRFSERLESLDLSETGITDHSAPLLANCQRLRTLNISGTRFSDAVIEPLTRLTTLTEVQINRCEISPDGISQWKALRPDLRIVP